MIHGFCVSFTSVTNTARRKSDIEQVIIAREVSTSKRNLFLLMLSIFLEATPSGSLRKSLECWCPGLFFQYLVCRTRASLSISDFTQERGFYFKESAPNPVTFQQLSSPSQLFDENSFTFFCLINRKKTSIKNRPLTTEMFTLLKLNNETMYPKK
jgi:hypothetical protein